MWLRMANRAAQKRKIRALQSFHRLIAGEERAVALQTAAATQQALAAQAKLDQLNDYQLEYLQSMREQRGVAHIQARSRQLRFIQRLDSVIQTQRTACHNAEQSLDHHRRHWAVARQREQMLAEKLNRAKQQYQRQVELSLQRESEEESAVRLAFEQGLSGPGSQRVKVC